MLSRARCPSLLGPPCAVLAILLGMIPAAAGDVPDPVAAIPGRNDLAPLRTDGPIERRTQDTLWERMNGQAELYRVYGLLGSAHAAFMLPGDDDRRVELSVFALGKALEAFGLYAYFRSADCAAVHLGNGACVGDYQAFLWSGNSFVSVDASGPEATRRGDLRRALEAADERLGAPPPLPPALATLLGAVPGDTVRYEPRHLFGREVLPPGLEGRWQGIDCFIAPGPIEVAALLARYQPLLGSAGREDHGGRHLLSGRDPVLGPMTLLADGRSLVGARSSPDTPGLLSFLAVLFPPREDKP